MIIRRSDIPEDGLDLDLTGHEDLPAESVARHSSERGPRVGPRLKGRIRITVAWEDLFLLGSVEGTLILQCSRCLEEFRLQAKVDLNLVLRPRAIESARGPDEAEEEAMDAIPVDPEQIDLADIIVEELLLEAPMKPLCDEGCTGLCPGCGMLKKSGGCSCPAADDVDPKWAVLAKLKENLAR